MSRPNIGYPTPIHAPSFDLPMSTRSVSGLEASPIPRVEQPRQASSANGPAGTLDTRITRLLVTTKQLLQGLDSWARCELDEEGVSDVYVKLGNGFEICVAAFQKAGIDTRELDPIPQDLRECLEEALSAEQSQETLNRYLPQIRQIIFNLLNGLKQKQAAYKRLLAERQPESPPPVEQLYARPPRSDSSASGAGDPRLSARSGTSTHSQASSASVSPRPGVSQLPPKAPSSAALAERPQRAGLPARPAPPDAFRPPRMRAPEGPRRSVSPSPQPETDAPQLVRHQLVDNPIPASSSSNGPASLPKSVPPRPDRYSRDSFGNPRLVSRFSVDSDLAVGSPGHSLVSHSPPQSLQALAEAPDILPGPPIPPSPPAPASAPSLPTLNFPSTSLEFGEGSDNNRAGGRSITSLAEVPAETRATLAALGRADGLERRASKRFSSYTFSKMLPPSPSHSKSASTGSPQRPMRRVDRPPPMPALPESLASSNLAVVAEDARSRTSSSPASSRSLHLNGDSHLHPAADRSPSPSSAHTDESYKDALDSGSVRIVKTPDPEEAVQQNTPRPSGSTREEPASAGGPTSISVFLQIGPQVKKATLDLPVTLSALRLMFMERFEYDPGMDDFPEVYMRDPRTGVQYELEDMEDLREGCVLNLNIEILDQVKQHIDHSFATLMQELKEVKSSIDYSRRISVTPAASLLTVSPHSNRIPTIKTPEAPAQLTSPRPDRSASTAVPTVLQADLRAHQDEVQNLRRDLAIMRQVHVDFLSETKDQFARLREQSGSMRQMITTKSGGSRALLDVSKAKIEDLCQETIQAVDDISDMIDAAREDAHKRFVIPSKAQMVKINADLAKATELVDRFTREVTAVEPTWRATWHFELSRVMEEQKLLPYQTKLTADLKNDIKDATEILSVVQDFVHQRQAGLVRAGPKGFRPPEPDVAPAIPNLLMEIRTKESADPTQRLRAIEAQQKAREKEKANQTDEFSEELAGFVGQKKLKRTGGTEEAERQRQRRHDVTVRRMLSGSGEEVGPGPGILSPQITGASMASGSGTTSPTVLGSVSGRSSRNETKGE